MKKWLPWIIIAILAVGLYSWGKGFNNTAVEHEADAKTAWSKVESAYQRRADLIPNLVATVKGYAAHEKETLEGVIKARSEATKTTINAGDLTPEKMAQFQQAQQGLSGALSKLLVTVERYPELKADKSFLELQSQLEGTEITFVSFIREASRDCSTYRGKILKNVKTQNTLMRFLKYCMNLLPCME